MWRACNLLRWGRAARQVRASCMMCRVQGSTPLALSGFHADSALRSGAACWSPVWVGSICRAAPGDESTRCSAGMASRGEILV